MKKLIMSLVVSVPLVLSATSSVAANAAGSVSYERADTAPSALIQEKFSGNTKVGTKYAYWHRGHRWHRYHYWHRPYRWHRWHRWHRW